MDKIVKINLNMGMSEYEMYQDIPEKEVGIFNPIKNISYDEFLECLKKYIADEKIMNLSLHDTTTNRYIYYVDNYPVGEIGIRTTLNEFWINNGSQIFYKIRLSKRNKGYGTRMLFLVLQECRKLGFKQVRINCNDLNYASQKIILKNGGKLDKTSYKTLEGTSSSYIIKL